jgi:hypothetical protein
VEVAAAHRIGGGGHNEWASHDEQAARWSTAAASTVVCEQAAWWRRSRVTGQGGGGGQHLKTSRSERGRGEEFFFIGCGRERESEDAIASGEDAYVRSDDRTFPMVD